MDAFYAGLPPEQQSRGRGEFTLCAGCNNFTGGEYGAAFAEWVKQGLAIRHHWSGTAKLLYAGSINPLRVGKQILTMFFATCGPRFRDRNIELADFIFNPEAKGLPDRYKLYAFWTGVGIARQSGVASMLHMPTGQSSTVAEVVHWPFGYLLEFSGRRFDKRPCDIGDFFRRYDADREALYEVNVPLPVLPTLWGMPGDFRTQDDLDRDVIRNWLGELGAHEPDAHVDELLARYGRNLVLTLTEGDW